MSKILRQAALFLVLIAVVLAVRWGYDRLGLMLAEQIVNTAQARGIIISLTSPRASFPAKFNVTEAGIFVPIQAWGFPMALENIDVRLRLRSLFGLSPSFDYKADTYNGRLLGRFGKGRGNAALELSLSGQELSLRQHPLLRAIGVDGLIGIDFVGKELGDDKLLDYAASITFDNVSYRGHETIQGVFRIPTFDSLTGMIELSGNNSLMQVSSIDLRSSLGTLKGTANLSFDINAVQSGELNLELSLTEAGSNELGSYLALAAGQQPTNWPTWRITYAFRKDQVLRVVVTPFDE